MEQKQRNRSTNRGKEARQDLKKRDSLADNEFPICQMNGADTSSTKPVKLSNTTSDTFFRETHPGSEMASQHDQNGMFAKNDQQND